MSARSRRIRRRLKSSSVQVAALLLMAASITIVPAVGGAEAHAADESRVQVPTLTDPAAPPAPLPMRQRDPVKAPSGAELGVTDVKVGGPRMSSGTTVAAITSDLREAGAQAGPNYDIYTDPETGGSHVAVVYTEDINERAGGSWRAADGPLVATASGYVARRAGNASVSFPQTLSSQNPVTFAIGNGSLTIVPQAVSPSVGIKNGDSVTYPDALAATDIKEEAIPGGFKETLVLKDATAPTTITWQLGTSGLSLDSTAKDVAILSGSSVVARMPIAMITDASGRSTLQPLALDRQALTLTLALDPTFLSKATYPITVDPGASTLSASRDTYTDSGTPTTSYETQASVYAKNASPTQYAWLLFDTSGLANASRLVYSADLKLRNQSGTATTSARQVTAAWPTTMTYNNQPSVSSTDTASTSGSADSTWTWAVGSLYQRYIEGSATDYGVRLASSGSQVRFASSEHGTPSYRPSLVISYNDLPAAPTLSTPEGAITTDTPVLSVTSIPSDPNADSVLVRFEVALCPSGNCASADFSNPVWVSSYQSQTSATVGAGVLVDGNTYSWRAVARDVCAAPSTLCSLTDTAGNTHGAPTSSTKTIQVTSTSLGRDRRYEMWQHDMGNGMSAAVNLANGNLNLDIPFDHLSTKIGGLRYGLSYNSLSSANPGLGAGWQVYASPQGMDVPVGLEYRSASASVRLTMSDGRQLTFVGAGGRLFLAQGNGSGAGKVTYNPSSGSYAYMPSSGGKVVFAAAGGPTSVRMPHTIPSAAAGGAAFTYTYDGSGHLTSVTDPDSRTITFTWAGGTLDKVTAQDARIFDLTQTSGSLSILDPTSATITVARDTSSRPTEIKNGAIVAAQRGGWVISYNTDSTVSQITAAAGGGAATSPAPWVFTRTGPFFGGNASVATLTDPRGSAPTTFTEQVDFNTRGLPIRIAGQADQTGYWPIQIKVWDTNGNLACERSAAANAKSPKTPDTCASDQRSTINTYESYPPYRFIKAQEPIDSDSGGSMPQIDQTYVSENGLSYANFLSLNLGALPAKEGNRTSMSADYGSGAPSGVTGTDNWAIQLDGSLDVSPGTYRFRFYSNDGITVVAGTNVLTDCYATQQSASNFNCGTNTNAVLNVATAGRLPFTVYFSELTGNASFDLQWDAGVSGGGFSTIPGSAVHPAIDPEATNTGTKIDDGSQQKVRPVSTLVYSDDERKATGLPSSMQRGAGSTTTTTTSTYDDFGRVLSSTEAYGTPASKTTDYTFGQTDCFLTQSGPVAGASITQTCNARGKVTSRTVTVRAAASQSAQSRVTSYTYDNMGRLTVEDPPGDAYITHSYDTAGRELSTDESLATGVHKVTTNTYDDAGHLLSVATTDGGTVNYTYDWADNQLTESDPRNSSWKTTKTYDAANREISSTSPSGLVTATVYTLSSGGNYVNTEARTEPNGAVTTTTFDLVGNVVSYRTGGLNATTYVYDDSGDLTKVTNRSGAETVSHFDALGHEWETKTTLPGGNWATTTSTYDAAGNLTSIDGPRTNVTDVVNITWDDAGNLLSVEQAGLLTPNTTTYVYDDANELVRVTQPLDASINFVRNFTYDTAGTQVTVSDSRGTITNTYDAGNRLVSESLPNGVSKTHTYDAQGRELSVAATKSGFSNATRSFVYDLVGNMTRATQGSRQADLTYDSDGRLTQVTTDAGDSSSQAFNASTGNQTSLTTVAGVLSYTWNSNGLLSTVTDPFTSAATTYSWDSAGRLTGRTDPAGLTWTRTYDAADRVDTQTIVKNGTTLASFDLGYDAASNVTSRDEVVKTPSGTNLAGSGTWTYGYDAAGRMTAATDPSSVVTTYGYDRAGNRTSVQVGNGTPITTTYDSASLPTSSSDGLTYTYDAMGTLTTVDKSGGSTGDQCFSYDQFGLLAAFKRNATTGCGQGTGDVTYAYDALGRTVSRTGTAITTNNYVLTGEDLARTTTSGTSTLYLFSPEGLLASSTGGQARFFLKDLHGDTVGAVNASGSVAASKLYSPWGEPAASAGESLLPGFQSQPTDADTGYVDMNTRLYSPTQGRFTTRDVLFGELRDPLSANQYAYAEGNPVTLSDAMGMQSCGNYVQVSMVGRNANKPWVKACADRTSPTQVKGRGYIMFSSNDSTTKIFKIKTNVESYSGSSWEAESNYRTARWCHVTVCDPRVENLKTGTPVAGSVTCGTNGTGSCDPSGGNCGVDKCYKGRVTWVYIQDNKGEHSVYVNIESPPIS